MRSGWRAMMTEPEKRQTHFVLTVCLVGALTILLIPFLLMMI